ncbi:MAG: hypothetical protein LBR58_11610 [Propionibacteriaceae bacterium]|jgi:hypothetical protein|nr:hypothetical protein [Propionibacteriaceae bacterium]
MIRRLSPVVALAIVASLLVYLVNSASGQTLQRPELNNTGIWASSNAEGMVGRFAKAASALEFGITLAAADTEVRVDVLQDGDVAVAWDQTNGVLYPVDALTAKIHKDRYLQLPEHALVDMRGGTLAVMDAASGKVWAVRTMDAATGVDLSPLEQANLSLADLGTGANSAALAVGVDGTVHAVTSAGKAVQVPVDGDLFGVPEAYEVQKLEEPQITAVGAEHAILGADGTLLIGSQTVAAGAGSPTLQQPSDAADHVYVATSTQLVKVTFAGLATAVVSNAEAAQPIAPAVVAGCAFAVWGLQIVRDCGVPDAVRSLPDNEQQGFRFDDPVFRVNRGLAVLNDRESGTIYDWDRDEAIQEWSVFDDQEPEQEKNPEKKAEVVQNQPPRAEDDYLGVRKGRSGVLHVLDNDSDPNGSLLSIVAVTQPKGDARVTISPDGQTLLFFQPTEGADTTFNYTIRNDFADATGTVHVAARDASQLSQNDKPKLRENAPKSVSYAVGSLGSLPIAVATDYRDPDADAVTVAQARDDKGNPVPITADAQIEYTAPETKANQEVTIEFKVTDGLATADGSVKISVIGTSDKTGVKPQAQADVARGVVGEPITITPLANDIPGVDPSNPQARLKLAADVDPKSGLTVHTDRSSGIVTVTASKADRYKLSYSVSFGTAPRAQDGQIRVDVAKKLDDDLPVAMPDEVTIHATSPANFDPLKNDFDPGGGMLSVVSAVPEDPDVLSVAVWDKRWIRVEAESPEISGSQAITYQVTNGDGRLVNGTAVVTQLPPVDKDEPLLRDDWVTARAGDSVLIPVLENDTTTGASTLSLLTNSVEGSPGVFQVTETSANAFDEQNVGEAYATGNQIRYVAPAPEDVTEDRQFRITYYARTTSGQSAEGAVHVTVKPALTEDDINSAPQPQTIEARVVSGEQVTIKVPSTQQDPDGDSVTLVKIASAPTKGRVLEFSPDGIVYESFPDPEFTGTDSFQYVLADQYGKEGTGTIRVNVISPGQTQPPLAVDDPLTAEPGATVQIDVMDNDYISSDDVVEIALVQDDGEDPVAEIIGGRFIRMTAPAEGEPAVTVDYELKGNGDGSTVATASVTGKEGFKNPPRVEDKVAVPGEKGRASVDLLEDAYDPDSDVTKTKIAIPHETEQQGIVIQDGVVELNMSPLPQIVTFVATDESGAATSGIIYVPARDDGFPYATGLIEIPANSTESFDVTDYVKSSRPEHTARITVADLVRATPGHLSVEVDSSLERFTLTSANDYTGPGAVTMQVTDGAGVSDPDGKVATVSIPVQVGPVTPVLSCPEAKQVIRQGTAKNLDVRTLCHIWPADTAAVFEYEWAKAIDNVSFADSNQTTLKLTASGSAKPGDEGSITVRVAGESAASQVNLVVAEAAPPKINPITVEVKQGETATAAIRLSSPLANGRQDTIVSCVAANDAAKKIPCKGADTKKWSVTPTGSFSGQLVYKLTVSDISDASQLGRQASTTLTVNVYGVPGAPPDLRQADGVQSNAITMAWGAAAENGAPIDEYELKPSRGAGPVKCPTLSCTVKPLANGDYGFQVRAHNKAGWGEWSNEVTGTADAFPDAPAGCVTSNPLDGQITLSWLPVSGDYSAVKNYYVRYSGQERPFQNAGDHDIDNLDNVQTTFEIWSENNFGRSLTSCTAVGWPTGKPQDLAITSVEAVNQNADNTDAKVTWAPAKANGEGPVEYTLSHNGQTVSTCVNITETSCLLAVTLDGAKHTFKLSATNKPHKLVETSEVYEWYAEGIPPQPPAPDAQPTGENRTAAVSGHTPSSRGKAADSYVLIYSGSSLRGSATLSSWNYSKTIEAGDNGDDAQIAVKLCYTNSKDKEVCGEKSASKTVTPFGPMTLEEQNFADPSYDGWSGILEVHANGNGRLATLKITWDDPGNDCDKYDSTVSKSGDGHISLRSWCRYMKWDTTRTATVTLTSEDTVPKRTTKTFTIGVKSMKSGESIFSGLWVDGDEYSPKVGVVQVSGSSATVKLWAHGGGRKMTLRVAGGCGSHNTQPRAYRIEIEFTCDIGWDSQKTFTVSLVPASTSDEYADWPVASDISVTLKTGPEP